MNTQNVINRIPGAPAKKRMSLDDVVDGVIQKPFRIGLHGPEKSGKSTFASGAPNPIFFGADAGTYHLNIKRMPVPHSFGDVRDGLADIRTRGFAKGYRTLVMDPMGWFQPMLIASFTGGNPEVNLATWGDGHGAGYQALETAARLLMKDIEGVWEAGLNVICIMHTKVKRFEDPRGQGYERYELDLENKFAAVVKQWVDHILFTNREAYGKTEGRGKAAKVKAAGSGLRMLYTEYQPAFDAGNRASLPAAMPLHWPTFFEAFQRGTKQREERLASIEDGLRELGDAEIESKVRGWLADPNADVAAIANAVASKLAERASTGPAAQEPEAKTEEQKEGQGT